ncbi:MAG TPA: sigma-54 dependent transcriptional regulator [Pseudomonadales bacterium]
MDTIVPPPDSHLPTAASPTSSSPGNGAPSKRKRTARRDDRRAEKGGAASAIISADAKLLEALDLALQVADSTATVLVSGESGTGKELLAKAIHEYSGRAGGPFVAVNCAAIPEQLLESELFGHEKGSFTGAERRREGRFERASGGTMFLDEIGDMSTALQAKILRTIEEGEVERVGGDGPIPVDVRLIAASNRCLRTDMEAGRFRADLYYRLAVVVVDLPPLRQRGGDVQLLARHFLEDFAVRYGRPVPTLSEETAAILAGHGWPGNVRELRNAMQRALLLATEGVVLPLHLPAEILAPRALSGNGDGNGALTLRERERDHIAHVLTLTDGNRSKAAELLGIHRNTLHTKIRQHGLM